MDENNKWGNALRIGNRLVYNHPQFSQCACGITSQMFCNIWGEKPFSLCIKYASQETTTDKK